MSETTYCFVSTMACNAQCDLIHDATGQCKLVMLVNQLLGNVDGPVKTAQAKAPTSPLVSDAMKGQPDFSEIEWMVKGNKDARDTDPFAYAFAFKYQTDELRPEAIELYEYLTANEKLVLDGFIYTISGKEKNLFARNKAKEK